MVWSWNIFWSFSHRNFGAIISKVLKLAFYICFFCFYSLFFVLSWWSLYEKSCSTPGIFLIHVSNYALQSVLSWDTCVVNGIENHTENFTENLGGSYNEICWGCGSFLAACLFAWGSVCARALTGIERWQRNSVSVPSLSSWQQRMVSGCSNLSYH